MKTKSLVTLPGQEPVLEHGAGQNGRAEVAERADRAKCYGVRGNNSARHRNAIPPPSRRRRGDVRSERTVQLQNHVSTGGPGTCVFMPRGIGHAWKNSGTETGRAFFIYKPGEAGKVFEESVRLQRPAPTSTTVDLQVAELFRRYGWEIVGPPPF